MTSACSGAMEMAGTVLCDPRQSILLPSPGFGLWKGMAEARDVVVKYYKLLVSGRVPNIFRHIKALMVCVCLIA